MNIMISIMNIMNIIMNIMNIIMNIMIIIIIVIRKWCGDTRPPALTSNAPMLVGYMALVPGSQGASGDRFR